jgi:bacterioferritin (cytochrome b1)
MSTKVEQQYQDWVKKSIDLVSQKLDEMETNQFSFSNVKEEAHFNKLKENLKLYLKNPNKDTFNKYVRGASL